MSRLNSHKNPHFKAMELKKIGQMNMKLLHDFTSSSLDNM